MITEFDEEWKIEFKAYVVHFYVIAVDDQGKNEAFACTTPYIAKGRHEKSLADLIGDRVVQDITPVQYPIIEITIQMPKGSVFKGEDYTLGYDDPPFNETNYYDMLVNVLLEGIVQEKDSNF